MSLSINLGLLVAIDLVLLVIPDAILTFDIFGMTQYASTFYLLNISKSLANAVVVFSTSSDIR